MKAVLIFLSAEKVGVVSTTQKWCWNEVMLRLGEELGKELELALWRMVHGGFRRANWTLK